MATTYTGRLLAPFNFGVPAPIDIAVQLGRIPRFVGATRVWPWTVLHHVLACYELAHRMAGSGTDPGDALLLAVLLHEADEVATGDVPTTFKAPATKEMQRRIRGFVNEVYGVDERHDDHVKRIDWLLMAAEMRIVGPPFVREHSGMDVYELQMRPDHVVMACQVVHDIKLSYDKLGDTGLPTSAATLDFLNLLRRHGARLDRFGMEAVDYDAETS